MVLLLSILGIIREEQVMCLLPPPGGPALAAAVAAVDGYLAELLRSFLLSPSYNLNSGPCLTVVVLRPVGNTQLQREPAVQAG